MQNVVLINPFEVPAGRDDEFLAGWSAAAEYMSARPGFVRTRLHRALSPDSGFRFVNVAEWASPGDFEAAVKSEEFRRIVANGPPGMPALYEVVRDL